MALLATQKLEPLYISLRVLRPSHSPLLIRSASHDSSPHSLHCCFADCSSQPLPRCFVWLLAPLHSLLLSIYLKYAPLYIPLRVLRTLHAPLFTRFTRMAPEADSHSESSTHSLRYYFLVYLLWKWQRRQVLRGAIRSRSGG